MLSRMLRSAVVGLASTRLPRVPGAERARAAGLEALLAVLLARHSLGETLAALDGPRRGAPGEEARIPGALRRCPTSCLVRSLAGYAMVGSAPGDVRFVIGVRLRDQKLIAHAWLERGGAPVGEPHDPRKAYAVVFTHPPLARADAEMEPRAVIPPTQPRPSPDVLLTELPDGTGVLLHLGTKFYYALNRTGLVVWKRLAAGQPAAPDALAQALATEFADVTPEQARADVDALLRELADEGLLLEPRAPPEER